MSQTLESEEFHDCKEYLKEENCSVDGNEAVVDHDTKINDDDSLETVTNKEGKRNDEYFIDEEYLAEICELLTEEEKSNQKETAIGLKANGNHLFSEKSFEEAAKVYTEALRICPVTFKDLGAILYSNRAACFSKMDLYDEAVADCVKAIQLDESFTKAILRRAQLYEQKEEYYDKALDDFHTVLKQQPNNKMAHESATRLPILIAERNEKMKNEMVGKLKDLGNIFLRPFGLSTDNFQLEQQPGGGYSVKIQK